MRLLIVTAVDREAEAVGAHDDCVVIASGVGRTNAAVATTEAVLTRGPFDAVINAGVAGVLPGAHGVSIGDVVVASSSVYMEEGSIEPGGFRDMAAMGFPLGDFEGNAVPGDARLIEALAGDFERGVIATVATCSGTDAAARSVVERTGAVAEAMEGAAVVHTAGRLGLPAVELRAISNTTGDRGSQRWDLDAGLAAISDAMGVAVLRLGAALRGGGSG